MHFVFLCLWLVNALLNLFSGYSLLEFMSFSIAFFVYLSAFICFIFFLKKRKTFTFPYFSLYPVALVVAGMAWLADGLLTAIVLSVLLFPQRLNEVAFENDHYRVYESNEGFLSICCQYEVKEKHGILEKSLMKLGDSGPMIFQTVDTTKT